MQQNQNIYVLHGDVVFPSVYSGKPAKESVERKLSVKLTNEQYNALVEEQQLVVGPRIFKLSYLSIQPGRQEPVPVSGDERAYQGDLGRAEYPLAPAEAIPPMPESKQITHQLHYELKYKGPGANRVITDHWDLSRRPTKKEIEELLEIELTDNQYASLVDGEGDKLRVEPTIVIWLTKVSGLTVRPQTAEELQKFNEETGANADVGMEINAAIWTPWRHCAYQHITQAWTFMHALDKPEYLYNAQAHIWAAKEAIYNNWSAYNAVVIQKKIDRYDKGWRGSI